MSITKYSSFDGVVTFGYIGFNTVSIQWADSISLFDWNNPNRITKIAAFRLKRMKPKS